MASPPKRPVLRTVLALAAGLLASCQQPLAPASAGISPEAAAFGNTPSGEPIKSYTLTNRRGSSATIINYGAAIADLRMPDRGGKMGSVILPTRGSAEPSPRAFAYAAVVHGRVANRIAKGQFTLDGRTYQLARNGREGVDHLHGGRRGFGRVLWNARAASSSDGPSVELSYVSADGEEGYPGRLIVTTRYTLTHEDTLRIDFTATSDRATPINLTNHAFFNLNDGGAIDAYELTLDADRYTVADEFHLPTGEIRPVDGTSLDFRLPSSLGARALHPPTVHRYNHNLVLRAPTGGSPLRRAARLSSYQSGRALEVWTTEPGLQLFTSSLAPSSPVRQETPFICLETQHFPDSVNHPHFPSTILRPGTTFRSTTEFRFATSRR